MWSSFVFLDIKDKVECFPKIRANQLDFVDTFGRLLPKVFLA